MKVVEVKNLSMLDMETGKLITMIPQSTLKFSTTSTIVNSKPMRFNAAKSSVRRSIGNVFKKLKITIDYV